MRPGEGFLTASEAHYHADSVVNANGVNPVSLSAGVAVELLDHSPAHAWTAHPRLNPHAEERHSKEMDLGTACHALLLQKTLEPVVFADYPDWKKGEAQKIRNEARADGKVALLERQRREVMEMFRKAEEAVGTSEAPDLMSEGSAEQAIAWYDPLGAWCRSRLDWWNPKRVAIVDYKTTTNAEAAAFIAGPLTAKSYDVRSEFYCRGVRHLLGIEEVEYWWLVQETKAPFECSLVRPGPMMVQVARDKVEHAIKRWAECLRDNRWPGYNRRTAWAEPKPWAVMRWEEACQARHEDAP